MAANDYVKLWIEDYKLLLEPYSMEERGRIIWAMMDYKGSHIEPEFVGNERFVWPSIKQRLDAEIAAYDRKVEINQTNGKKGGRPKKPKETQNNRLGFEEKPREPGKVYWPARRHPGKLLGLGWMRQYAYALHGSRISGFARNRGGRRFGGCYAGRSDAPPSEAPMVLC